MKTKFFIIGLFALPLGLVAFKPATLSNSEDLAAVQRVSYEAVQGKNTLYAEAGFVAKKGTITKSAETSTVSSETVVASFATLNTDNVSLDEFIKSHE